MKICKTGSCEPKKNTLTINSPKLRKPKRPEQSQPSNKPRIRKAIQAPFSSTSKDFYKGNLPIEKTVFLLFVITFQRKNEVKKKEKAKQEEKLVNPHSSYYQKYVQTLASSPVNFKKFLADKLKNLKDDQIKHFAVLESQKGQVNTKFVSKISKSGRGNSFTLPLNQDTFHMRNEGKFKGSNPDNYMIMSTLGQGAYADVKKAIYKGTEEPVALKIYEKIALQDQMKKNNVIREIHILETLDHPNIIKIYDCLDTTSQVIIILEQVEGISLKSYLAEKQDHRLRQKQAFYIFKQILDAVAYIHGKGITHRDLKLENILLTPSQQVKIIDFGFSTWTKKDGKLKTFCGTPTYMAPEIINKNEYQGPPTDMWALGIILYTILCGTFPFQGAQNKELYKRISKGIFSTPRYYLI